MLTPDGSFSFRSSGCQRHRMIENGNISPSVLSQIHNFGPLHLRVAYLSARLTLSKSINRVKVRMHHSGSNGGYYAVMMALTPHQSFDLALLTFSICWTEMCWEFGILLRSQSTSLTPGFNHVLISLILWRLNPVTLLDIGNIQYSVLLMDIQ